MVMARMQAGRKGVQPLQAMRQPVFDQKLQRAIGDGRLAAEAFGRKAVQHLIGAHGAMRFQQDLQRPLPDRGQAGAIRGQPVTGLVKHADFAGPMIVRGKGGMGIRIGQYCYFITFCLTCYDVT